MDKGAKEVIIAATHPVLSDPAAERLSQCGAVEVIVTNTLPVPEEKQFDKPDYSLHCSVDCSRYP